jgi:hypothetical protein
MKENSWNECLFNNFAIKVTPDKNKALSLIDVANGRIKFIKRQNTDLNYVFEAYYASLIEYVHAFLIMEGYKVLNHLCLGYYIRDELNLKSEFHEYELLRRNRNNLVYYGSKLSLRACEDNLIICLKLINLFESFLSKLIKKH